MGKALADPLFWVLAAAVAAQLVSYVERRRLGGAGRPYLSPRVRRAARASRIGLAVATLALWLLSTHAVESFLIGKLSSVHPIPSEEDVARIDVVVVLSGGFVDAPVRAYDQPDAWTTARVIQGVRTFFDSNARVLVMSGRWARANVGVDGSRRQEGAPGVGETGVPESGSEQTTTDDAARLAIAMKQLAVNFGVPPERIVIEPNARTTREHPVELLRLGVVEPGDTVGVVTSSWHLPRAVREFEKVFDDVVAVPAFDVAVNQKGGLLRWMPRSMHLESSATALAEYIGMLWYRLSSR